MTARWYVLELNAEPWAVGPLSVGRRGGKPFPMMGRNLQLHAFKEAVKDEMRVLNPTLLEGKVELKFLIWRQQAEYTSPQARTVRKHEADATNLQKALEDALQGIIMKNDKDVASISTAVVAQGPEVDPLIVIYAAPYESDDDEMILERLQVDVPDEIYSTIFKMRSDEPQPVQLTLSDDL